MKFLLIYFSFFSLSLILTEARHKNIRGKYARNGQFPFVALLTYGGQKFCGGSIIHDRWILTAAHCLMNHGDVSRYLATVGTAGDFGSGTDYDIERIFIHPHFNFTLSEHTKALISFDNDIALMRLASKITFNDEVQSISLATNEQNSYQNSRAKQMGWGTSSTHDGPLLKHLSYIDVWVSSPKQCRKVKIYTDKNLCTSTAEHKRACQGDSGSPLILDGIQIGVMSVTERECRSLNPDIYTKVASHVPWIKDILREYGDQLSV